MKKVVIIGGTSIDYLAHSSNQIILHESNSGLFKKSWGGVAKNIAENLARLNVSTTLYTVLGEDASDFISMAEDIKLTVNYVEVDETPVYVAIHDKSGELVVSVNDGSLMNKLTPEYLMAHHHNIKDADLVVIDANLSDETIAYVFGNYRMPIYVDLINSSKVNKFLPYIPDINTIRINLLEGQKITLAKDPIKVGRSLLKQGIKNVYLTLGKDGAYLFNLEQTDFYNKLFDDKIKNDNGVEDAFYAGAIYAELHGLNPLKTGTILSQLTLQTFDPVYRNIKATNLVKLVKE